MKILYKNCWEPEIKHIDIELDVMEPRRCHAENNYWAALIRAHDLVIRAHELLIRAHGLVIRAHGLVIRAHELITLIRAHELLNRARTDY